MIQGLVILLGASASLNLMAQDTADRVHLRFSPVFRGKEFVLAADGSAPASHQIKTFKCYLSAFALTADGQVVWSEKDSFHFLDATDPTTMEVDLAAPKYMTYDAVQFQLGIDSPTSVSGAMGGDLDPTKGMYWTWNSELHTNGRN